jgi:hypothetical protein
MAGACMSTLIELADSPPVERGVLVVTRLPD